MARPLRLEYEGSLWHITARGNERRVIFRDDEDRAHFIELLAEAVRRFAWILTAYVLMPNHYHLVVELAEATLSKGMKWLNGTYTQWFNRRHDRVGHLFQGRFKSFLVEKESYYLEVHRYVVLNPVRASIVGRPEEYEWSSHRAMLGSVPTPDWLAAANVLRTLSDDLETARRHYETFVNEGIGMSRCPWDDLAGQIYLGSDDWQERVRLRVEEVPRSKEHPRVQRVVGRPRMTSIVSAVSEAMKIDEQTLRKGRGGIPRTAAAWIGCYEGMATNGEIAAALGVRSSGYVSRMIRQCEAELAMNATLRDCVERSLSTLRRNLYEGKT